MSYSKDFVTAYSHYQMNSSTDMCIQLLLHFRLMAVRAIFQGLRKYSLTTIFVTVLFGSIWWDQKNRAVYVDRLRVELEETKQKAEELKKRSL